MMRVSKAPPAIPVRNDGTAYRVHAIVKPVPEDEIADGVLLPLTFEIGWAMVLSRLLSRIASPVMNGTIVIEKIEKTNDFWKNVFVIGKAELDDDVEDEMDTYFNEAWMS